VRQENVKYSDVMALYFGLPYEPLYMTHGRVIWLRLQTQRYQEVYMRTQLEVAHARTKKLFAEEMQKRDIIFDRISADSTPWNGGSLVVPFGDKK
jgi:hypothetical protein